MNYTVLQILFSMCLDASIDTGCNLKTILTKNSATCLIFYTFIIYKPVIIVPSSYSQTSTLGSLHFPNTLHIQFSLFMDSYPCPLISFSILSSITLCNSHVSQAQHTMADLELQSFSAISKYILNYWSCRQNRRKSLSPGCSLLLRRMEERTLL